MKAIISYIDAENKKNTALVCDSAIIRSHNPFFLPDDACRKGMVLGGVRINRLGKGITAKYADRYYAECLSAVHPYVDGKEQSQLSRWGIDGALVVGDPAPSDTLPREFKDEIDRLIDEVSQLTTLKTGDLVLMESPRDSFDIANGRADYNCVSEYGTPSFVFKVR